MANPNYFYYSYLISFVVLLIAQNGAGDDAVSLLGGKKLIIGVPKKHMFTQFVDAQMSPINKKQLAQVTGYAIEVFNATVSHLERLGHNISFEYRAFVNESGLSAGNYNELLQQIPARKYDAVVGDVTIVANRSTYVDFTLPFVESGVMMLVRVRRAERLNMWNFLRPFRWDLWLSIFSFSIYIGCIIRFMERKVIKDATFENISPRSNQLSGVQIFWFPLTQVFLPERESVAKKCSRFVLVMWLILACILMQSYTASLSSILTVDQLQPSYPSVNDLIKDPKIKVGYPGDSFIKGFIVERLKFDASKLRPYFNVEQYREALDIGSRSGGVDAVFDEVPYLKIFLNQQRSNNYAMVGTRYRTDGFGFAFPKNSNLTSYFSSALLNVTESEEMELIEQKYFGSSVNGIQEESNPSSLSSDTPSLTTRSFAGLFLIIGCLTFSALLLSESCIWRKPVMLVKTFSQKYLFTGRSNKISHSRDVPTTFGSGEDIHSADMV